MFESYMLNLLMRIGFMMLVMTTIKILLNVKKYYVINFYQVNWTFITENMLIKLSS